MTFISYWITVTLLIITSSAVHELPPDVLSEIAQFMYLNNVNSTIKFRSLLLNEMVTTKYLNESWTKLRAIHSHYLFQSTCRKTSFNSTRLDQFLWRYVLDLQMKDYILACIEHDRLNKSLVNEFWSHIQVIRHLSPQYHHFSKELKLIRGDRLQDRIDEMNKIGKLFRIIAKSSIPKHFPALYGSIILIWTSMRVAVLDQFYFKINNASAIGELNLQVYKQQFYAESVLLSRALNSPSMITPHKMLQNRVWNMLNKNFRQLKTINSTWFEYLNECIPHWLNKMVWIMKNSNISI
eukprot:453919_1